MRRGPPQTPLSYAATRKAAKYVGHAIAGRPARSGRAPAAELVQAAQLHLKILRCKHG